MWPSFMLSTQMLLRDRLPALVRSFEDEESRLARAVLVLLGYLRAAAGLAALTLLAGPSLMARLESTVGGKPWRWWAFATALAVLLLSWRLMQVVEQE
jgi:hypothetical protein